MLNTALLLTAVSMGVPTGAIALPGDGARVTGIIAVSDTIAPSGDDRVDGERQLGEAHVTAERNTAYRGGAPAWRVSAAEIQQRGAVGLAEVLRTLPSIGVKDYGGIGGLKTVSIRSFGAQHTGVIYDGVAVTDCQNGQVDIGRFGLDNLSSISVDVAGSDDIFQPARLASYVGNVSLLSAPLLTPDNRPHGSAQLRVGSFGTVNPRLSLRQRLTAGWTLGGWADYVHSRGDYPFRLHNSQLVTDEVRLNSDVEQWKAEARLCGDMHRYGTLQLKADLYDASRGLPGSVVLYTQHPTEHLWDRTFNASALYRKEWGSAWRLKTTLAYTNAWNRYVDTDAALPSSIDDRYRQQMGAFSAVALWQPAEAWQLSFGEDLDVAHLDSSLPDGVRPTRMTSYTALSARYSTKRFTAVGTWLGMGCTESTATAAAEFSTPYRLLPSFCASYRLLPDEDLRLRASYKESQRLPTFNDLYYLRVGNRNLRPERARQFNFGATWQRDFGNHQLGLTADSYYNYARDKIVAVPTMFVWHMRNVGRVDATGIDCSASYSGTLAPWFKLTTSAHYALQHAVDVTDATAKNYRHQIPYTPRHSGGVALCVSTPWINVGYTLSAVGERYSLAQNVEAYRINPYCDHSVSLNRTFRLRHVSIHASVEGLNLSDRNYEIIKYYPMPGRHFRASLRFEY